MFSSLIDKNISLTSLNKLSSLGASPLLVLYGLITGVIDFMFWLGYQIGPPYAILVTILLIISPFILWYLYDKLKSKGTIGSLSNKIKQNKKLVSISILIVLLIIILIIVVPIVTYNPLDSEPYTIECPESHSIYKEKSGYPGFDNKFNGFIKVYNHTDEIEIWHRNADGKDLKYYLNQIKSNYLIRIDKVKNISIDGEQAYEIKCSWKYGKNNEKLVICIHDNEYYLIYFDDDVPKETHKAFLDSFKFK